jgi:hypothetical protein
MRKNLLFLGAISIVLILTAILSGIYFTSTPAEPASAKPEPVTIDPIAELYSFGDDDKYSVLLDLAEAQTRSQTTVILTAAAPGALNPEGIICTHTGVSVTAPPAGVAQHVTNVDRQAPTIWHQAANWLSAPFQDHYAVTLWVPDSENSTFRLVSGDAPGSPVVCADQVDEDV